MTNARLSPLDAFARPAQLRATGGAAGRRNAAQHSQPANLTPLQHRSPSSAARTPPKPAALSAPSALAKSKETRDADAPAFDSFAALTSPPRTVDRGRTLPAALLSLLPNLYAWKRSPETIPATIESRQTSRSSYRVMRPPEQPHPTEPHPHPRRGTIRRQSNQRHDPPDAVYRRRARPTHPRDTTARHTSATSGKHSPTRTALRVILATHAAHAARQ